MDEEPDEAPQRPTPDGLITLLKDPYTAAPP